MSPIPFSTRVRIGGGVFGEFTGTGTPQLCYGACDAGIGAAASAAAVAATLNERTTTAAASPPPSTAIIFKSSLSCRLSCRHSRPKCPPMSATENMNWLPVGV